MPRGFPQLVIHSLSAAGLGIFCHGALLGGGAPFVLVAVGFALIQYGVGTRLIEMLNPRPERSGEVVDRPPAGG